MLIQETYTNETKGYQFGTSEPYEPFTQNIGSLFLSTEASDILGTRDHKKVANNTILHRTGPGEIALRLHETDIRGWLTRRGDLMSKHTVPVRVDESEYVVFVKAIGREAIAGPTITARTESEARSIVRGWCDLDFDPDAFWNPKTSERVEPLAWGERFRIFAVEKGK